MGIFVQSRQNNVVLPTDILTETVVNNHTMTKSGSEAMRDNEQEISNRLSVENTAVNSLKLDTTVLTQMPGLVSVLAEMKTDIGTLTGKITELEALVRLIAANTAIIVDKVTAENTDSTNLTIKD